MNRYLVAAVIAVAVVAWPVVSAAQENSGASAGDSAGTTAAPSDQERVAQLEKDLKGALAHIELLEQRIATLEKAVSSGGKNAGAGRAADKRAAATPKADDAPLLAKDSKLSGKFTNTAGDHAATAVVRSSTRDRIVLRVTNEYGTRDWELAVKPNGDATLIGMSTITAKFNNTLKDFKVTGTVGPASVKLSGSITWQGPSGGGTEQNRLELSLD